MGLRDLFKRKPKLNQASGSSGRQHTSGFLEYDEVNVLLRGKEGLAVFDSMYRTDPDVKRNVLMFTAPVVAGDWTVEPYGGDDATDQDRQIADDLAWALGIGEENGSTSPCRPTWKGHLAEAAPVVLRAGFAPFEVTWTSAERVTWETPDTDPQPGDAGAPTPASSPPSPADAEARAKVKALAAPPVPKVGAPSQKAAVPGAKVGTGGEPPGAGGTDAAGTPPVADPAPVEPDPVAVKRTLLAPRKIGLRLPRTIEKWHQDELGDLIAIEQFVAWRPVSSPGSTDTGTPGKRAWSLMNRTPGAPKSGLADSDTYAVIDATDLLYYRVGAEGDNWEGQSMLRPVYKPWLLKDKIERLDAIGNEREAVGITVLYPPQGYHDQAALDALDTDLANIRGGESAHVRMPGPRAEDVGGDGWHLEVIGLGGTTNRDPQPSLQYHRDAIAAAFATEFMRLGQGGEGSKGAMATAETQDDPFHQAVDAFADVLSAQANEKIAARFVSLNYGPDVGVPTIKLAEADEQSLTDLQAFLAPLLDTAIHPDDDLEDYLRKRSGLPPADPLMREQRKQQALQTAAAEQAALEKGALPDPQAPAGEKVEKITAKHEPGPDGKMKRSREKITETRKVLDDDADEEPHPASAVITLAAAERRSWEPPTLDRIAAGLDAHADTCGDALRAPVSTLAALAAGDAKENGQAAREAAQALREAFTAGLTELHALGDAAVKAELMGGTVTLADNPTIPSELVERGVLAAKAIATSIWQAVGRKRLLGETAPGRLAQVGEDAGRTAARQQAQAHGSGALNLGRDQAAVGFGDRIKGARYTSILDANRCEWCARADDDVLRALDDPIRLERKPPNPDCLGWDKCRCIEVYELDDEAPAYLSDAPE